MATPDGKNGKVHTMRFKTPDGTVVYVGPWTHHKESSQASAVPSSPPSDPSPPASPLHVPSYGEPLETMAEGCLHLPPTSAPSTSSYPPHSRPLKYIPGDSQPPNLEQALGELNQAKPSLVELRDGLRGLSVVATVATYTLVGLIAGVGIGTAAYHLMDNQRSLAASIFTCGVVTLAGVAAGVYQARRAEQRP